MLATLLCVLAVLVRDGAVAADELSPEAELGRLLFVDTTLSASGRLACASCHDPGNAYAAPAAAGVVMLGGAHLDTPGIRTVPSLRYMANTPRFARHFYIDKGVEREDIGAAGGFMLDGRAENLQAQALLPWFDQHEMANSNDAELAERLLSTPYTQRFAAVFGDHKSDASTLVRQAAQALERFELEDPSFKPYSSRYDDFLAGRAQLSPAELNGLRLFADPNKGNCAACHLMTTEPGGRGPAFTDHSFHALGVPRNSAIPANRDTKFFDLGLCGPLRTDLATESGYCGYFKTPTLRNVARRRFLFHNGRFSTLDEVLHFYVERDLYPAKWYPLIAGKLRKYDDLPRRFRSNVNTSDPPLAQRPGMPPALDAHEIGDVIAFLRTLNDVD